MGETFSTKILRFLPLPFKTIVPRATIDAATLVSFPPGFHGTNPSIVPIGDGYLVCVRGVNHVYVRKRVGDGLAFTTGDDYENVNRFALLDRNLSRVRELPDLSAAFDGLEDIRLFRFGDEIMALANAGDPALGPGARSMRLLHIDRNLAGGEARILPSPYGFRQEKNWAPFELDGELHFVYSFDPLVILRYDSRGGRVEFAGPRFEIPAAGLRFLAAGSSAGLPTGDGFLFATHRRTLSVPLRHRYYLHRLCRLDARTFAVRYGPYFSIGEHTIQFVNGLVARDDEFVVCFGIMDGSANLARVAKSDIYDAART